MSSAKLVGDESDRSESAIAEGGNAILDLLVFSSGSRRIINLSPVMVIPEEQPAQPALPIQPEGMRVVCGHCGNTFLVGAPQQPSQTG